MKRESIKGPWKRMFLCSFACGFATNKSVCYNLGSHKSHVLVQTRRRNSSVNPQDASLVSGVVLSTDGDV